MEDSISFIFAVFAIVLVCMLLPILNIFLRQDDMSYTQVLKATTNFVDTIRTRGYIDNEIMSKFTDELASTGLLYNIEIEAHRRYLIKDKDDNSKYVIKYLVDYNDQIFEKMDITIPENAEKNGMYNLNFGDKIYVKVNNLGNTISTDLLNSLSFFGDKKEISVSYGGRILSESWKENY